MNRRGANRFLAVTLTATLVLAATAAAQEHTDSTPPAAQASGPGEDSDPTKPIVFSLRDEYVQLSSHTSVNAFMLRVDRLVLKGLGVPGPTRGILGRLDIPLVTASNPMTTETGLGNIYLQGLVAPQIRKTFAIAAGTGLQLPTASSEALGSGKWIVSPAIVPILFFPHKGYAFLKFQNWISVAGDPSSPDVNYLLVTATILRRISRQWWAQAEVETKTNWLEDSHTGGKVGGLLGVMVTARTGIWVKLQLPFGQYGVGEYGIQASVFRTRF